VADEIDAYVDYSGTIWANHMKRSDTPNGQLVLDTMTAWLAAEHGIEALGPLGFENAYALAMRRDHAEKLGITSIADLAPLAGSLTIGGDYEFFARPEWLAVRDAYGLAFAAERTFDSTLMYSAAAEVPADVISAFSTDGRIAAFDLLVLDEPRQAPGMRSCCSCPRRASARTSLRLCGPSSGASTTSTCGAPTSSSTSTGERFRMRLWRWRTTDRTWQ